MGLTLRLATPDDAPDIRSIYAPFVESTPIAFETDVPTTTEMADQIETRLQEYPWLVCESSAGDIVGYTTADSLRSTPPYAWTVELSVYVIEDAQQSGVGTALYTSLLEILQIQGYYNAYAVITLPNPGSIRLHENMGFEPAGTFPAVGYKQGDWHDIQWWHRQLADRPSDPNPPQPLATLRGTSDLEQALERGESYLHS